MMLEEEIGLVLRSEKYGLYLSKYGYITVPLWGAYNFTMDDVANDLDGLPEELGVEKCTLIGYPIGGKITAYWLSCSHLSTVGA